MREFKAYYETCLNDIYLEDIYLFWEWENTQADWWCDWTEWQEWKHEKGL